MTKQRPSNLTYKQSELRRWLFMHIFRTMYAENISFRPHETIRVSDYTKLPDNERMKWIYSVVPDDEYVEFPERSLWNNTVNGMTKDLLARWPEERIPLNGPRINTDNVREALKQLSESGLVTGVPGAHNQQMYYPNESLEGIRAYVDWISDHNGDPYRMMGNAVNTSTTFWKVMVNRQLVVDVLKEAGTRFTICVTDEQSSYDIELPLLGRYPRIYEMDGKLDSYIYHLKNIRNMMDNPDPISMRDIGEALLEYHGVLDKIPDKQLIGSSLKDQLLEFMDGYIDDLENELVKMRQIKVGSRRGTEWSAREWFSKDQGRILRREALWEDMIDISIPTDAPLWRIEGNRRIPIHDDGLKKSISDQYGRIIEDRVILPILCLIEMSPTAMHRFLSRDGMLEKQVFELDGRGGNSISSVIDRLLLDALGDYVSNNTYYVVHGSVGSGSNCTSLHRFGDISQDGSILPALFTFRINDGRCLSIYRSNELDAICSIFSDDMLPMPDAIDSDIASSYLFGQDFRTPQWLSEILEGFIHKCGKPSTEQLYTILRWHIRCDMAYRSDE